MRALTFAFGFALSECVAGSCLAQQNEVYEYEHTSNDGVGYQEVITNGHYRVFAPIHIAAMRGDVETIRSELAEGVPVDLKVGILRGTNIHYDATPLMWAVARGKSEAARFLIEAGADANARSKNGLTPLMAASGAIPTIDSDLLACVQILIEAGADIEATDVQGCTAMFYACGGESPLERPLNELLSDEYRIKNNGSFIRPHVGGGIGLSRLVPDRVVRARQGDAQRLAALIDAGGNINAKNKNGKTILMQASRTSDPQRIKLLIDAGVEFTLKKSYSWDTLLESSHHGNSEMFALLLKADKGAKKIDFEKNGGYLLCGAASSEENAGQKVRLLLDAGADPNSLGRNGRRPLLSSLTSRSNDPATVMLLEAGADPTVFDRKGNSSFILAARSGSADALKILLEHDFDIESRSNERLQPTALILAAKSNLDSAEKVKLLLEAGAEIDVKLKDGTSALLMAARSGNMAAVEVLANAGADANAIDDGPIIGEDGATHRFGQKGMAPLMYVANRGGDSTFLCEQTGENAVRSLIDNGAELDIATPSGETALVFAIKSEHTRAVQLLLEAGADPNVISTEQWNIKYGPIRSALGVAIEFERPDALEMLLKAGADPNAITTSGSTALCLAALAGDVLSVQSLLKGGALIDAPNGLGLTPLMNAFDCAGVFSGFYEAEPLKTAQYLIDTGANVNAVDKQGRTVLMHAADSNVIVSADDDPSLISLLRQLLDLDADPEARDNELMTPLMYAAMSRDPEHISILVETGVDLDAVDNKGRNALIVARQAWDSVTWDVPSLKYIEQLYKKRDK